jgi:excisionase family DNA binding protein
MFHSIRIGGIYSRYNWTAYMVKQPNKSESPSIEDLISLKEAAEICGLTQPHLALLIRQDELWGTKLGGRNWFTTKSAVEEYLARGRRPGPKPED